MTQRASRARTVAAGGAILAPVAAALTLAACGSGHSSSSNGHGNGVAVKPPARIVAAAQAALRSAHGFVAAGTLRQGGQAARLRVVDDGPSKLQVQISQSGTSADIIALPGAGYVRGNQAFWSAHGGAQAATLANRWIELPASASQQLTAGFGEFRPSTLARCLGENLGRLSRGGTTTVDGRSAVVVRQAGNVPGSSPGTIAVATTGPPYPLRVTSTGPTRAGGKIDACNTGKADDTEGSLTLSDFDHAPAITAPQHPVKLGGSSNSSV